MAKTKPIGVRFDKDMLEVMKEDKIAETPQSALNFLSDFWNKKRDKVNFTELFKESNLFKQSSVKDLTKQTNVVKPIEPIGSEKTNYTVNTSRPKNLEELKAMCPKELTGFERSEWIATERQRYGV